MCLLDFVEKNDRVRMAAYLLGKLPTFFVSDISRRRADEPRYGVLLHVFGHIDPHHGLVIVEEKFSQCARQFCLADACWAQEDK